MTNGWSDTDRKALIANVNMIMGNTPGPPKPRSHYFSLADQVVHVIQARLRVTIPANISKDERDKRGEIVSKFLRAAIDAVDKQKLTEENRKLDKNLNSARAMLEFTSYTPVGIDNIVYQYRKLLPSQESLHAHDSVHVRRLLAKLAQEDSQILTRSLPTIRKYQEEQWAPAVVDVLYDFLHYHPDRAKSLAIELGLDTRAEDCSAVSDQALIDDQSVSPQVSTPSSALRHIRSLSSAYWQDLNAATGHRKEHQAVDNRAYTLNAGLYVHRSVQNRIVQEINQQSKSTTLDPILICGEAGHGKSCLMWALDEELRSIDGIDPVLLNATWFMPDAHGRPAVERNDIVSVAIELREGGSTPVVLIDTADLLLHNEIDIMVLVALCKELEYQSAVVVLTCRPEEAAELDNLDFERFELKLYDDQELADAVEKYAEVFCPGAEPRDPKERVALVAEPVARGHPLREVCRSPLLIRLLFELNPHPDTFPELREVDVSRIYREYWDRRVVTDKRLEGGSARQSIGADLSRITGRIAIVLLAIGRTELERDVLIENVMLISSDLDLEEIISNVDELLQRSVLKLQSERISFFHQTMFEYAAAKGLIASYGASAVYSLVPVFIEQPEDLFVGAVLEQLLILAGRNPLAREAFTTSLALLAQSTHISLHNIALAAGAHHPGLSAPIVTLLESANEETASRYAQIAPSVAGVDFSELVTNLEVVWKRERCRHAVLESLERLAAREPNLILSTLRNWSSITTVLNLPERERTTFRELPRILGMTAHTDPDFARTNLLQLFGGDPGSSEPVKEESGDRPDPLSAEIVETQNEDLRGETSNHPHLRNLQPISKTSDPDQMSGRKFQIHILEICGRYWLDLASSVFVKELTARFEKLQIDGNRSGSLMQRAFGEFLGLFWSQAYASELSATIHDAHPCESELCWARLVKDVVAGIEKKEFDPVYNAQLIGIGKLLTSLSPRHWALEITFSWLTSMQTVVGPLALPRGIFPTVLNTDSPAASELEQRLAKMLNHLPASKNRPPLGAPLWGAVARQALRNAQLDPARLAGILQHGVPAAQQTDLWLIDDGLAWLLVPAALGGHPAANAALAQLEAEPELVTAEAHELIRDPLEELVNRYPESVGLLVDLSVAQGTTSPLNDVLKKHGSFLKEQFELKSDQLWILVQNLLLTNSGKNHRDGTTLWILLEELGLAPTSDFNDLHALFLRVTDYRARGSILEICAKLAQRKVILLDQARTLLEGTFAISGEPPAVSAIIKARNYPDKPPKGLSAEARDFAVRSRNSLVELLCQAGQLDDQSMTAHLDMAAALPTNSHIMGQLGHVMIRLVDAGRPMAATQYFLEVTNRVTAILAYQADTGDSRLAEDNLGNRLRPAIRKIFQSRDADARALLVNEVPNLPETHARMVVASAASEANTATYDSLSRLLAMGNQLPRGVATQIASDRRSRSQSISQIRLDYLLDPNYRPHVNDLPSVSSGLEAENDDTQTR